MDNILRLVGLCQKAGQLQAGDEPTAAAARARRARLILLADNAADNTVRRAKRLATVGAAPLFILPCAKESLGMAIGRNNCAMAAVTDAGLAAAIARGLAGRDPDTFGVQADALEEAARKLQARRREQAARGGKKRNVYRTDRAQPARQGKPGAVPREESPNPNGGESY